MYLCPSVYKTKGGSDEQKKKELSRTHVGV
jgi:hypothetical protein